MASDASDIDFLSIEAVPEGMKVLGECLEDVGSEAWRVAYGQRNMQQYESPRAQWGQ